MGKVSFLLPFIQFESAREKYMGKLKTRFIFGGIAIGIIFFISLCQSLLNS
jgi:hypothetical protein